MYYSIFTPQRAKDVMMTSNLLAVKSCERNEIRLSDMCGWHQMYAYLPLPMSVYFPYIPCLCAIKQISSRK